MKEQAAWIAWFQHADISAVQLHHFRKMNICLPFIGLLADSVRQGCKASVAVLGLQAEAKAQSDLQ